jgi:alpha-1,2-mannosyltransferase
VLSPLWWTPHNGHPLEYGFHPLLTPVANCYLLAGVVFLAHMAIRLRATPPALPSGRPERRRSAVGDSGG